VTTLRWTEHVADIRAIREFIERDSPRYGRLVAERLVESTSRIELFRKAGRVVPEVGREDLREIIVGKYRVICRLEAEAAALLTVFRSSRLLPARALEE